MQVSSLNDFDGFEDIRKMGQANVSLSLYLTIDRLTAISWFH